MDLLSASIIDQILKTNAILRADTVPRQPEPKEDESSRKSDNLEEERNPTKKSKKNRDRKARRKKRDMY